MSTKRSKTKWPNVVRYPDGTYYAFLKPLHGGSAKEVSLRTKKATMVPAALKIADLKVQRSFYAGSKLTLEETIFDYLDERKAEWKIRTYELNLFIARKYLVEHLGRKKIAEIDHNVWQEYTKKNLVKDYMNHRYVLRNFLEWCMYKNWLPAMPLNFKLPKHKRAARKILKPEEVKALLINSTGRLEVFVHLCLFHGLRQGEAASIKYSDINWKEEYLLLPDTKTNMPRVIPLFRYTFPLLQKMKESAQSNFLFQKRGTNKSGASITWFRKSWAKTLKKAGLSGYTPHDLRATGEKYASKLTKFTRTNREKMFGASVEVQDKIYLTEFFVDELRGLESAMIDPEKGIEGLQEILHSRRLGLGKSWDKKMGERKVTT